MSHIRKILEVKNVTKIYKVYKSNFDRLREIFTKKKHHKEFISNKDISFDLFEGETLGIIGVNGAGKSTILKIIAGVTSPTSGQVIRQGRVTALLELGTGFNAELSGYQNIFLNGTLIGMSEQQCKDSLQSIISFSELGEYIHEPIKSYSSGMKMRLAFSIAIHSNPEILIVDEALSVGDAHFSAKCKQELTKRKEQNMSIIYVSHDLNSLKLLCDRVLLLDKGKLINQGKPDTVVNAYNILISQLNENNEKIHILKSDQKEEHGSFEAKITKVALLLGKQATNTLASQSHASIEVYIESSKELSNLSTGIVIRDKYGQDMYGTNTFLNNQYFNLSKGSHLKVTYECEMNLRPGKYYISAALHQDIKKKNKRLHWIDNAFEFSILGYKQRQFSGMFDLKAGISLERPDAKLLITTSKSVLLVDTITKNKKYLHEGSGLYYGVSTDGKYTYIAARKRNVSSSIPKEEESGEILVFDKEFNHLKSLKPKDFPLRDIHQIKCHNNKIYVTCTLDNFIAIYENGNWNKWYPNEHKDKDVNHFNSIYILNESIYILAHNMADSKIMKFGIEDLQLQNIFALGIQAHNINIVDNELMTLSSKESKIKFLNGKEVDSEGFIRGLAIDNDGYYYIGSSEIAERNKRDFTNGKVIVYKDFKKIDEISLENEGLVLDVKLVNKYDTASNEYISMNDNIDAKSIK